MRYATAVVVAVLIAGAAWAQDWRRAFGYRDRSVRMATADSFDGSFSFCRGMYGGYGRRGGSWMTDYPDAEVNFSIRLSELTKTRVSRQPSGRPNHLVVRLTDDELFQCPMVVLWEVGSIGLSDLEVARLRDYLLKGGFLWVDDFWGTWEWDAWQSQIEIVLPPGEYPIKDLTLEHPIFRTMFQVKAFPQIPSIQHWRSSGGGTSERGYDSDQPHIRGISDRRGRLMVLMTHNTDISDSWEREGEDPQYFYSFSPDGYAVGINVLMYAMSH